MPKKTTRVLVCDGGGMEGAFIGGILSGFRKKGMTPDFFDYYIGTSAGAFNLSHFITGQTKEGLRDWTTHLPNKLFALKKFKPTLDLTYLKKVITKIEPLDIETLKTAKQPIFITLTDPKKIKPKFVKLNNAKDPIKILLATAAMPFFSGPKKVGRKFYYDGGLTSQPSIDFAKTLKADEIWVLLVEPKGYRLSQPIHRMASWVMGKNATEKKMIAARPNTVNRILSEIETNENYRIIRPEKTLPVTWFYGSAKNMKATVKLGERAAAKHLDALLRRSKERLELKPRA